MKNKHVNLEKLRAFAKQNPYFFIDLSFHIADFLAYFSIDDSIKDHEFMNIKGFLAEDYLTMKEFIEENQTSIQQ